MTMSWVCLRLMNRGSVTHIGMVMVKMLIVIMILDQEWRSVFD